jgi:CBS domain-containing protein
VKIGDILKKKGTNIVTAGQRDSLSAASKLLNEHGIGVLLVVDNDGMPVGILSERDIVREFASQGPESGSILVRDAMTADLIVGVPDDDLNYALSVMTQQRIRHLPILDEGKLAGLVSIGDVVKAQIAESETEIRYLNSYITGGWTG